MTPRSRFRLIVAGLLAVSVMLAARGCVDKAQAETYRPAFAFEQYQHRAYVWFKAADPLPSRWLPVWQGLVAMACGRDERELGACAVRDYTHGVCWVFYDPRLVDPKSMRDEPLRRHEEDHCERGLNHN